jgi:hypothetical protein
MLACCGSFEKREQRTLGIKQHHFCFYFHDFCFASLKSDTINDNIELESFMILVLH